MPATFQILPERNLVYARYEGTISLADAEQVFAAYLQHPDCAPGQLQLVDLAEATGWKADFLKVMRLQAAKAGAFLKGQSEALLVYHAPTELARGIAATICRSWKDVAGVVPVVAETEADALAFLGLPETRFADLLAPAVGRGAPPRRRA